MKILNYLFTFENNLWPQSIQIANSNDKRVETEHTELIQMSNSRYISAQKEALRL